MPVPVGYRFHHQGWYYMTEEGLGPFFVSPAGLAHQGLDPRYMTDENGDYARLRVDPGQTSFWAGKQFRTFQKLTLPAGASRVVRATVGVNIVLYNTSFVVDGSSVEMELVVGGAAAGPWTPMPVLRKNNMTTAPVIVSGVTMDYDGAHVGGTVIDLNRIIAGNKDSSVGGTDSERGVGPGTYYYRLTNVGTQEAIVVFSGWWEERV